MAILECEDPDVWLTRSLVLFSRKRPLDVLCGRHVTPRAVSKRRPVGGPRYQESWASHVILIMTSIGWVGWFDPTYWLCLVGRDLGVVFGNGSKSGTQSERVVRVCCK